MGISEELNKLFVWRKGHIIPGREFEEATWRQDDFGNVIRYGDYGDRNSNWGWEIDHITPVGLGGSDDLSNLRPLRCSTNAGLGGLLSGALGRKG